VLALASSGFKLTTALGPATATARRLRATVATAPTMTTTTNAAAIKAARWCSVFQVLKRQARLRNARPGEFVRATDCEVRVEYIWPRSRQSSSASCWRSSGFLFNDFITAASSSTGIAGRSRRGEVGLVERTACVMAASVGPEKALRAVNIS